MPKIKLVLHNIRSIYNVGAILRTAEGLGVEQVIFSGYTPYYDNPALLPHVRAKLNHQIAKSALGAEKMIPQKFVENLPSWLETIKKTGWIILGLENNLTPDEARRSSLLGMQDFGDKIVLILGEEVAGIPPEIRQSCDYFLEIPMVGRKESFNVSVAAGIALWGLLGQHLSAGHSAKCVSDALEKPS